MLDNKEAIKEDDMDQYYTFDFRHDDIYRGGKSMLEPSQNPARKIQVRLSGVGTQSKVKVENNSSTSRLVLSKMDSLREPISQLRISPR